MRALAVAVLAEGAIVESRCEAGHLESIVKRAERLRANDHHSSVFDARLDALSNTISAWCRAGR